jgi:hypothetical protein
MCGDLHSADLHRESRRRSADSQTGRVNPNENGDGKQSHHRFKRACGAGAVGARKPRLWGLAENAQFSRSCSRNAMPGGGPRLAEEIAVMRGQDDHKYGFWACPSRVVFRSPPVISSSWLKVNMCVARGVSCFWVCDLRLVLGRIDVFYRLPLGRSLSFYLEQLHYGLGKQIRVLLLSWGSRLPTSSPPIRLLRLSPHLSYRDRSGRVTTVECD